MSNPYSQRAKETFLSVLKVLSFDIDRLASHTPNVNDTLSLLYYTSCYCFLIDEKKKKKVILQSSLVKLFHVTVELREKEKPYSYSYKIFSCIYEIRCQILHHRCPVSEGFTCFVS